MSGPQGSDETQPWPGQDQPSSDPSNQPSSNQPPVWQQPAPDHLSIARSLRQIDQT